MADGGGEAVGPHRDGERGEIERDDLLRPGDGIVDMQLVGVGGDQDEAVERLIVFGVGDVIGQAVEGRGGGGRPG